MALRSNKPIGKIFGEGTLIDEALRRAARRAILQHRQAGLPLVYGKDGRVIRIPADQVPLPEIEDEKQSPGF